MLLEEKTVTSVSLTKLNNRKMYLIELSANFYKYSRNLELGRISKSFDPMVYFSPTETRAQTSEE